MQKRSRSISAIVINGFVFLSVSIVILLLAVSGDQEPGESAAEEILKYFTNLSNIYCALLCLAAMLLELRLLKRGQQELPHWFLILKQTGTAAVALTFTTVICFLAPISGRFWYHCYTGEMFFLHFLDPLLAMLCFILLERGKPLSRRESLFALIPTLAYIVLYATQVLVLRHWKDFYGFTFGGRSWAPFIVIPVMAGVSFLLSLFLSAMQKRVCRRADADPTPPQKPEPEPAVPTETGPGCNPGATPTDWPGFTPSCDPGSTSEQPPVVPGPGAWTCPVCGAEGLPAGGRCPSCGTELPSCNPGISPAFRPDFTPQITPSCDPGISPAIRPDSTSQVTPSCDPGSTPEHSPVVPGPDAWNCPACGQTGIPVASWFCPGCGTGRPIKTGKTEKPGNAEQPGKAENPRKLDISRVEFSAVAPRTFLKGEYTMLDIIMYEPAFRSVVDSLLTGAEAPMQEARKGTFEVEKYAKVRIELTSPDLEIEDGTEEETWVGGHLDFSFPVMLPQNYARSQILFRAKIYINDLIATRLQLVAQCTTQLEQKLKVTRSDVLSAFISYASEDRRRVATIVQGMKARRDIDIFFDVTNIESGEYWEKVLRAEIEKRDILFLCWSNNAKASEWVDKEWHYALQCNGEDSIEPVPLEPPTSCPPPEELKNKHFNDYLLYIVNG